MSLFQHNKTIRWFIVLGITFVFLNLFSFIDINNDISPIGYVDADVISPQPSTMTGEMKIDVEMRMFQGEGGGTIKLSIKGEIAKELRRRIDNRTFITLVSPNRENGKIDGSMDIPTSEVSVFVELFEDRLEKNIIMNQYDTLNTHKHGFNGVFAGVDISRESGSKGVDITSTKGLTGTSTSLIETIELTINFGGIFPESPSKPELNNGEILFYALFGYVPNSWSLINETNPDVKCKESLYSIVVGLGSFIGTDTDSGDLTKYRIPGGEIISFSQDYKLDSDEKTGYFIYEANNYVQSSIVLAIYGLIVSIVMLLLPRSFYQSSGAVKKIKWIHYMAIGFFIIILLLFFLGVNGLSIWIGAPIFAVIVGIVASKKYSSIIMERPAGETNKKGHTVGKVDDSDWHQTGLSHFERGEFHEAVAAFDKALEETINDEVIWNDKGHVLRKLGRYEEALKCFNVSLKINPDYKIAEINRKQILSEIRKAR